MFSPSDGFQCSWRVSRWLLMAYGVTQVVALSSLLASDVPFWWRLAALLVCLGHAGWLLSKIFLWRSSNFTAIRLDQAGWSLWSQAGGWQPISILPSSVLLAPLIVLHFRCPQRLWAQSLCIAQDAMSADAHRRLRVLLKFSWNKRVDSK